MKTSQRNHQQDLAWAEASEIGGAEEGISLYSVDAEARALEEQHLHASTDGLENVCWAAVTVERGSELAGHLAVDVHALNCGVEAADLGTVLDHVRR